MLISREMPLNGLVRPVSAVPAMPGSEGDSPPPPRSPRTPLAVLGALHSAPKMVSPRILDAIQGRSPRSVAEGYVEVIIRTQAAAIAKLPRYRVAV